MSEPDFFKAPILNSPYERPTAHWELENGIPTNRVGPSRRRAELLSPIPKAKKQKAKAKQAAIDFDDKSGLEVDRQKYDLTIVNELRGRVDAWRELKNPNDWGVTPDTARLLQHWRQHAFTNQRPFFCQIEAVETAIWLAEVAPNDARASGSSNISMPPTTRPIPAWRASP